ncbi:hypothetical protein HNY73_011589 [Argiope bruennichi]|uniref:Uncharacterized protein n=1 Tax=Argiope bruennichi TaxID=94029 RepID=A0A8T0F132_ARGBR|nr:hypothetical protein HNY73_011589 [Argiope bruennichi]
MYNKQIDGFVDYEKKVCADPSTSGRCARIAETLTYLTGHFSPPPSGMRRPFALLGLQTRPDQLEDCFKSFVVMPFTRFGWSGTFESFGD